MTRTTDRPPIWHNPEQPVHPAETPEAVALELMHVIARAEGRPLTRRQRRGMNEPQRAYVLDLYSACLAAARGERGGESMTKH